MSKAFVKESDDDVDLPAVPVGLKNYMTPRGHHRMQDELRQLLRVERPKVVATVAYLDLLLRAPAAVTKNSPSDR